MIGGAGLPSLWDTKWWILFFLPINHLILPLQKYGDYNHTFWGELINKTCCQYAASHSLHDINLRDIQSAEIEGGVINSTPRFYFLVYFPVPLDNTLGDHSWNMIVCLSWWLLCGEHLAVLAIIYATGERALLLFPSFKRSGRNSTWAVQTEFWGIRKEIIFYSLQTLIYKRTPEAKSLVDLSCEAKGNFSPLVMLSYNHVHCLYGWH